MTSPAFPDITRPDADTVVIATRYAGDRERQLRMADTGIGKYDRGPWVRGIASLSWFLSTDGETVLTCAQWTSIAAHDAYLRGSGTSATLAGPPRYRLYRSLARADETRTPGCLVTAAFDVEGPERQRHFVDTLTAALPDDGSHPGALSAHFLLSADGTRVLNYTEWTSADAHQEAAASGFHDKVHEIFSRTPGVRLTHGKRYHLHRSLSRPSA
ncbi:antibiotic biosynthesis monooxygenase [Streptomyces griseoincarnatus]